MKTKASKVVWNQAEQAAVKDGLKRLLQANRHPRHSWARLLWVAQREVIPTGRWRNERSLAPGIFRDSKTNELHWGSPRDIVFEALRELQLLPAEQLRREPLPAREAVRLPPALKPEKAPAGTVSPAPKPIPADPVPEAERANQRLKELEKQYAEALTKLRQLEEERAESRVFARLEQLEAAVVEILEFITGHGFKPTPDVGILNRVGLARSFAA
jgi:hypothetical protein